jgi:ATP-dependent helicase/nuclease subunit A
MESAHEQASELVGPQREAATTLDLHVSVTAGPGAGKTRVLVARYLEILRTKPVSVDQIVAITFTNRAANEMRERLRKELDRLLRSAGTSERARWMRHKRTLDGAIITTIHGFCARLLRDFPVEAEVDPQFTLLDEHQTALLEESVAEESLTEAISSGHEAITRLTAGFGRTKLAAGLVAIYRDARNQGVSLDELERRTTATHATVADYNQGLEELDGAMGRFFNAGRLTPAARTRRRTAQSEWPELRRVLQTVSTTLSLAEYCDAIDSFRRSRPTAVGEIQDLVRELDGLIWEKKLGGAIPRLCFDVYAREYALDLIGVIRRVEARLEEEKRRLSALDFDDLQLRAVRLLKQKPDVLKRTAGKYRYFLVDEFQDTNGLQRDLMSLLALGNAQRANLFIVGDRKQSVYGFRGADLDVFREMTEEMNSAGGKVVPLNLNFRSQPPIIDFFNYAFPRIFGVDQDLDDEMLGELGYVEHETSEARRAGEDEPPLVEVVIDAGSEDASHRVDSTQDQARERDARQVAARIVALVDGEWWEGIDSRPRRFRFGEIAMLFRAMTEVGVYESALRRHGIPYLTVQGKGFYAREEITDLVQLLRFLDNTTDEVALAAVLRSPLFAISDNALFAIRCGPLTPGPREEGRLRRRRGVRELAHALRHHGQIDFIEPDERAALDRARQLLDLLVARRNRLGVADLLRLAVTETEYRSVIAAAFDGAQRLANVEKLFSLAERFERSGTAMIRDFVRFVHDFEETGGRESEGQIDESADVVRLMTVHQAKGLEFPVVVIPEMQRRIEMPGDWYVLDRHRGLTLKVPDGRGGRVSGTTMELLRERAALRERFESMRLFYVAATRARDRLVLSGVTGDLSKLDGQDNWLGWIWKALDPRSLDDRGFLTFEGGVQVRLLHNLLDMEQWSPGRRSTADEETPGPGLTIGASDSVSSLFPLLDPIVAARGRALHRFSVTQLTLYRRCQRQYYFDRILHSPSGEEIAVWNDAEAPEPPANLTATLRGAVIHRFCEKYVEGEDPHACLRRSFNEVVMLREAELGERIREIDPERAVTDLLVLARNYLASDVRRRIEAAREIASAEEQGNRQGAQSIGVFSERRFRLRRPGALLTGTIDKLLIVPNSHGAGLRAEIIDFKTNRLRARRSAALTGPSGQLAFDFDSGDSEGSFDAAIRAAAREYRLQMQSYALAVRELIPEVESAEVTLHFVDPNVEVGLPAESLEPEACARAIDEVIAGIISAAGPEEFPVQPAEHCRTCGFQQFCAAGREWLGRAEYRP